MPAALLLLLACGGHKGEDSAGALDLAEALGSGEVRAGQVTSEDALFGGVSAEGQTGDYKIYNSEAQFIIQGVRDGSYYVTYGGGLLDADAVRDPDEPGRDLIDEASPMVGLGRLLVADTVTVDDDGRDGGPAVIRVDGHGGPFKLLTGALESPDLIPDRDVAIETTYTLEPDSPLLRVETTVQWNDVSTSALLGDIFLLALDVADPWIPGRGLDGDSPDEYTAMSALSWKNEVVLSLFPDGDAFQSSPLTDLLSSAAPALAPLQGVQTLGPGDEVSWATWVGVGRDPAALTAAWEEEQGIDTETLGGTVTAGGEAVAGARVHLLDADGVPVGLAWTDADGRWSADLPVGAAVDAVATGRGHAILTDLPEGAGWYGPYEADQPRELTLASIADGAPAAPFAEGCGISEAVPASSDSALTLTPPGWLHVSTSDGLPAVARVAFADGDPVGDRGALVPDRPSGLATLAFLRDGDMMIPVEPGTYEVTVHRGLRWEMAQQTVEVGSGETVDVEADLSAAYEIPDAWIIDPHSHAAPSSDSSILMEDRLIVAASNGVQLHVGTDHDHIADYRPLLAPLGLDGVLNSVVADEVSPVLRGHFNAWPLEEIPGKPNHGAVSWWDGIVDTASLFADIRGMASDLVLQANHPAGDKGICGYAEYNLTSGTIGDPDRWSDDFDAMEVLNKRDVDEYLPYFLDLVNRGYTPMPVGVSDSHTHRDGEGDSLTFLHHDAGVAYTPAALLAAAHEKGTVVCRGPYIQATIDGAWAPGNDYVGAQTLDVVIWAPSWMPLDTISLLRDGAVVENIALSGLDQQRGSASFTLDPEVDASYIVTASGTGSMDPVYPGVQPWAMTAPIRIDLDGDGWDAPLPPLSLGG